MSFGRYTCKAAYRMQEQMMEIMWLVIPTQLVCKNEAEGSQGQPMPQSRVYGINGFYTPPT